MLARSRRFGHSRGVTVFEVGVVGSILAVAATAAAIWLGPRAQAERTDEAVRNAVPLRRALEAWQKDNPHACPSLTQLIHEGYLPSTATVADPWGHRYRLLCDEPSAVVAPGPDGELGTADDVSLRLQD